MAQNQGRSTQAVNSRNSEARRVPGKSYSQTSKSASNGNKVQQGTTSQRRYIPRYSSPKTTTKPSYNRSGTTRSVSTTRPSSVKRQGYSSPTQSRSNYSAPSRTNARSTTRSYSPGSSSSSGRSYSPSSSGSRSSGSSSRSSGSTSRSSSSGGRRR